MKNRYGSGGLNGKLEVEERRTEEAEKKRTREMAAGSETKTGR